MNLVFIYGPPAAGKLTIARELAKTTGYKLFDNHMAINTLTSLFPYEDKRLNPIRSRLAMKFRLEIFGEAAAADVDFITTCALGGPKGFAFFRDVRDVVEKEDGNIMFVQLRPSKEALFERVKDETRSPSKIDSVERLEEELERNPELFETFPDKEHLTIDNSDLTPEEVVERIKKYYRL